MTVRYFFEYGPCFVIAHAMLIDIVMVSRLGLADGGRETWLRNFLNEISRKEIACKFDFYTLPKPRINVLNVDSRVVEIQKEVELDCKKGKIPIAIKFIAKFASANFLKRKNADHVIAVGGLNEALAVVLGYLFRSVNGSKILWLRTIYTKENGYRLGKITQSLLLKFEVFLIKNFFQIVIANGEDTAQFYRVHGVNCSVIPNAIDLGRWSSSYSIPSKKVRIAFVGRLSEVKGIQAFLESVRLAYKDEGLKKFQFHVVGEGPFRADVVGLAAQNLLVYHGALANDLIPEFLKDIDCCVALTLLTNFLGGGGVSNALLEQMAAKKVIVAWDNEIFRRVMPDDCAYFINQGDAKGLTQTYFEIFENRSAAWEKASRAEALSQEFSIESHVKSFFELVVEPGVGSS